jgi:hypothetical protein
MAARRTTALGRAPPVVGERWSANTDTECGDGDRTDRAAWSTGGRSPKAGRGRRMKTAQWGGSTDEGTLTKAIESQTARIPSGTYLTLGIGAMALSLVLMLARQKNLANFVGQWVPTLLIVGLYNKLVKVESHE